MFGFPLFFFFFFSISEIGAVCCRCAAKNNFHISLSSPKAVCWRRRLSRYARSGAETAELLKVETPWEFSVATLAQYFFCSHNHVETTLIGIMQPRRRRGVIAPKIWRPKNDCRARATAAAKMERSSSPPPPPLPPSLSLSLSLSLSPLSPSLRGGCLSLEVAICHLEVLICT